MLPLVHWADARTVGAPLPSHLLHRPTYLRLSSARPAATPCLLQPEQIRQCLLDYASIGVWQVDDMHADTPTLLVNEES